MTTTTTGRTTGARCRCGRRMSRYARTCRACHEAEMAAAHEAARAVVATGRCPLCGAGLRRNLSLTGWYQCEQYGAESFRKDSSKPACGWQTFTD